MINGGESRIMNTKLFWVESAIFAPLSNLGLIIIDEEHEWSYKQSDKSPRYDRGKLLI